MATTDPSIREQVTVCGWGRTDVSSISDVLRYVRVPVESNEICKEYYNFVWDDMVCIDTTYGKGSCNEVHLYV
jgi:hypothetical protein